MSHTETPSRKVGRFVVVVPMWPSMAGLIPATVGEGRLCHVGAMS